MPIEIAEEIYKLIFHDILKMSRCMVSPERAMWMWGCYTGTFAHDFVMILIVPLAVGLAFYLFISKPLAAVHRGLQWLVMIAGALMAIYLGVYPIYAMLAPFWMIGFFGIGFVIWLVGRWFPPGGASAMARAAKMLGKTFMTEARAKRALLKGLEEARASGNKKAERIYSQALAEWAKAEKREELLKG